MAKLDVMCVGTAIVDIPLYPITQEILSKVSYPLEDISMKIGGDALNEATIITRLGNRVGLMSAVGDDSAGYYIQGFAHRTGINIDYLKINPELTTSINVGLIRPDGERTFLTNRNGSLWRMSEEDLDINAIKDAKVLSLASIFNNPRLDNDVLVKIFKQARAQNMIICADMVKSRLGEGLEDIKEALGYLDYFFPNYSEASELTGQTDLDAIADTFLELGVKHVVIKAGKTGCFIKDATLSQMVPAFQKPADVKIDTTGAGDNFVSGFIAEIIQDRSFKECAYFGNAVAAVSIEGLGATAGVQSREQVEDMIEKYTAKVEA